MENYDIDIINTMKNFSELDFADSKSAPQFKLTDKMGQYTFANKQNMAYICSCHDDTLLTEVDNTILMDYIEPFKRYISDWELLCKLYTTLHEIGHGFFRTLIPEKDYPLELSLAAVAEGYCAHSVKEENNKITKESHYIISNNHRVKITEAACDAYAMSRLPYILSKASDTVDSIDFHRYNKLEHKVSREDLPSTISDILIRKYPNINRISTRQDELNEFNKIRSSKNRYRLDDNIALLQETYRDVYLEHLVYDEDIRYAKIVFNRLAMFSVSYFKDVLGFEYFNRLLSGYRRAFGYIAPYNGSFNKEFPLLLLYNGAFAMFPYVWEELLKL